MNNLNNPSHLAMEYAHKIVERLEQAQEGGGISTAQLSAFLYHTIFEHKSQSDTRSLAIKIISLPEDDDAMGLTRIIAQTVQEHYELSDNALTIKEAVGAGLLVALKPLQIHLNNPAEKSPEAWHVEGLRIYDENRLTVGLFSSETEAWLCAAAPQLRNACRLVADVTDHKLEVLTHDQLRNLVRDLRGEAKTALTRIYSRE